MRTTSSVSLISAAQGTGDKPHGGSWLEAQAQAWSQTLDRQASRLEDLSAQISNGDDRPGTVTELSAAAQVMSFLATAAHTANSSMSDTVKAVAHGS